MSSPQAAAQPAPPDPAARALQSAKVAAEARRIGASPLGFWPRFGAALLTWSLLCLSQPGVGRHGGFGHTALVALIPWALYCSRPGKRAFLAEWAAAALGLVVWSVWLRHVIVEVLWPIGIVTALYVAFSGVVLRLLARRFPLALAAPAAWLAGELPRWCLEAPFSFGWWRLGTMLHDTHWLVCSARVWGIFGLSWIVAAFAGVCADKLRHRKAAAGEDASMPIPWLAWGLGPMLLGIFINALYPEPEMEEGPDVLLVTPGIEQERKKGSGDPVRELYGNACQLMHEALEERRAAGQSPPDLIAWGESMLNPFRTVDAGWEAAVRSGVAYPDWAGGTPSPAMLEFHLRAEGRAIRSVLFGAPLDPWMRRELERLGKPDPAAPGPAGAAQGWTARVLGGQPLLDPGTSFLAGAEHHLPVQEEIRRQIAIFLWDAEGERHGPAAKVHLVPGAESLAGAQVFPWVVAAVQEAGGYVPDFIAAEEAAVLPLASADGAPGRAWRFSATTCYDNAFDDPYTAPMRRERVDFHLVASNEAWYEDSYEMNHMVAFSRCIAAATARSIVRATNSGITIVIDPRGETVGELVVQGRRKMVRGTLSARVPVPAQVGPEGAPITLYALTQPYQPWLFAAFIAILLLLARGSSVTQDGRSDRPRTGSEAPPRGA